MSDILALLQEFYRQKQEALVRHEAAARLVGLYDANNAYQYVINRDEVQLTWLATAIRELDGQVASSSPAPERASGARGAHKARAVLEEDASDAQSFVDRWRPRVDAMTNARHRGMLRVVLGETLEQKRTFEQALAGRTDMLGGRPDKAGPRVGVVLPARMTE